MSDDNPDQIRYLAERLADTERSLLDYQHRLREVESGRTLRGLSFIRRFLVNPVKGVKLVRELPSLVKKIDVPPLPSRMPVADDYLKSAEFTGLPAPISRNMPSLRYPYVKAAVIGEVGWLHTVCHAFALDRAEWKELLRLGIDMLVINQTGKPWSKAARDPIIKAFAGAGVPVVYFVHNDADVADWELLKAADLVVCRNLGLLDALKESKDAKRVIMLPPGVEPQTYNPIDWHRKPAKQLLAVGGGAKTDELREAAKEILGRPIHPNSLQVLDEDDRELVHNSKQYRAALALPETFADAQTFAVTVLRLLASGTPVLTPGNDLLKELLPDYPRVDALKAKTRYEELADTMTRERASIEWRRRVLDEQSDLRRFETLLAEIGIPLRSRETISIIMSTKRPDYLDHAFKQVADQTYPNKELIVVLHGDDFDRKKVDAQLKAFDFPTIVLERPEDSLFGDNLNLAVEHANGELISKMDDDDYYGPNHLLDIYVALQYSGAEMAGKWGNFVYLTQTDQRVNFQTHREEHFAHHLPGATFLVRKDLLVKIRFGRVKRAIDSELYRRLEMRGGRLYSTHRFNFVRVRHNDHTYEKDAEDFIAHADGKVTKGLGLDETFI